MVWPDRLSFNQYTAGERPLDHLVAAAEAVGVTRLGLQRRPTEAFGFERSLDVLRATNILVTSYGSVGGWASVHDETAAARNRADNLRYLDQAMALGTAVVTMGSGGLTAGDRDLRAARDRVEAGIVELLPSAADRGLRLALEPLHPVFCPDYSVVPSLRWGVELVERIDSPSLGLLIDTMHVWWDPDLEPLLRRAASRVFLVQVNDWLVGAPNRFDRGLMGEGCIDFAPFITALERFDGIYEVETLNDTLRTMDLAELLQLTATSFERTFGQRIVA